MFFSDAGRPRGGRRPRLTSAYLKDLVVHPHYQGLGIASALLAHVFSVFKQRGEACVDLKVMAHNLKACCLYTKHGMALVQRLSL